MAKSKATLLKQINACKTRLAKERDKLRDLSSELDDILGDCEEAVTALEDAADALSRFL